MPYRINTDDVADDVRRLNAAVRYYWNSCLEQISHRPDPHQGAFIDRMFALFPVPTMTYRFEITREAFVSGEEVYVFSAGCLPRNFRIGYLIERWNPPHGELDGEVKVAFLRGI